jgi:hypothetical protein
VSGTTKDVTIYIWSPGRVIRFDPDTGIAQTVTHFRDFATEPSKSGAIVLIAHRGSVVRQVPVPNLSKEQISPLLPAKLTPLLPAPLQEYFFGFRLVKDLNSAGKLAIVGASKAESIRKIYAEAELAGIKIDAVFPAPFASWLAAHFRGVRNGVVVSLEGADLCLDVIVDSELKYSRFTVAPGTSEELASEIAQTLKTAGAESGTTLLLGDLELPGSEREPSGLNPFLSRSQVIEKLLFSIQLPEQGVRREAKKSRGVAQRAVATALVATALWSYLLYTRSLEDEKLHRRDSFRIAFENGENVRRKALVEDAIVLRRSERLINLAFDPPQTFGDIVTVIGDDSDKNSWLTGLSLERGKPMTLRGEAGDGKTVYKLVSKLSAEPRFRNVTLLFAKRAQIHDRPVVQFAVSATPVGNLPFDQDVKSETEKP